MTTRPVQMIVTILLLIGLVASPAIASDAEPTTVEDLVVEIEKTYGDVQSLRADLEQVSRNEAFGEQKTKGKVSLKRPGLMKWDFTEEPGGSLFVTNGKKMWVYSPTDSRVLVSSDLSQAGGGAPIDLLNSLKNLTEHFDVKLESLEGGKDSKSTVLVLTPKAEAPFKSVRLVLSKRKYEIENIAMTDAFGTEVEIIFSRVQTNSDIPDSEFDFNPPAGVEVIDADSLGL